MTAELEQLRRYHDQGDASAFSQLVNAHARMVFATARRITRDASLAEDVAQETFLELARRGRGISDSVSAWLYRAARHLACNAVRADVTRKRYEAALPEQWPHEGDATWQELEPLLDEALMELPPQQSSLIIEHFLEGRTQTDIARSMGVSQSSVSRLIDQAIDSLRSRLKAKGVLCGAGLGVMIATQSAEAAPVTLISALNKIGLSGMGCGGAAGVGATVSSLLTMKMKLALAVVTLLLVGAVGYDLASAEPYISRWMSGSTAKAENARQRGTSETMTASKPPALLVSASVGRWGKKPDFDLATLKRITAGWFSEKDPAKQLALLRSIGINISVAAFERFMAEARAHPGRFGASGATRDLLAAWALENPQEALVWMTAMHRIDPSGGARVGWQWAMAAKLAMQRDPAAWDAFLKSCPDPAMVKRAQLWLRELDEPGSIWANGKAAGLTDIELASSLSDRIRLGPPDETLRALLGCEDSMTKRQGIMGLAPRLSPEQLMNLATHQFANDEPISQVLRALAGDATASFDTAIQRTLECRGNEFAKLAGLDPAGWAADCAGRIYEQWMKVDPAGAIRRAASGKQEDIDFLMAEGLRQQRVDEASVVAALAGLPDTLRDQALTALYHAQGDASPQSTLQQIMSSAYIQDEVAAAKPVLIKWADAAPSDAARWVAALPKGSDRAELAAIIARRWVDQDIDAGIAFAQQEGVGLSSGYGFYTALTYASHAAPEAAARYIQQFRGQPQYADLIVEIAAEKYPRQPAVALRYMADNAPGAWQQELAGNLISWLKNNDYRGEVFARAVTAAEFAKADPQTVANAGQLYVKKLTERGQVQQAFNWTLQLPNAAAPLTRGEGVARLDVSKASNRNSMTTWLQAAAISAEERARLMQLLAERIRTRR